MKHDLFIDNNIACRFSNPMDINYKNLLAWLNDNHEIKNGQEDDRAYLVVSKKLLGEYCASCRGASADSSIPVLVNRLLTQGRLITITNAQIKSFQQKFFTKAIEKKLQSNSEDRNHIPVVLLSDRKYALTNDEKFTVDLENFPGYTVLVSDRPEKIPYNK